MSDKALTISTELKATIRLAAPIVVLQAGHMSMGLVDTLVMHRFL
jgi:Na+-driven multidrug efflux pump